MSLVISLRYEGGILLACDSKAYASSFEPTEPVCKMAGLSRFCAAGFTGVGHVADCVISQLGGTSDRYIDIALLRDLSNLLYREYGRSRRDALPEDKKIPVNALVVGYSNDAGKVSPVMYGISSEAFFHSELLRKHYCVIGITDVAHQLLLRHFRKDMPFREAAGLAYLMLDATSEIRPEQVGSPFRIATITASEGYHEFVEPEEISPLQGRVPAYKAGIAKVFTETFQ